MCVHMCVCVCVCVCVFASSLARHTSNFDRARNEGCTIGSTCVCLVNNASVYILLPNFWLNQSNLRLGNVT